MTLTIELNPEIEQGLTEQAQRKGLSLEAFAGEVLAREAHLRKKPASGVTGQFLIDAAAPVRGLFTDEEIDDMFRRTPSYARPVNFE